MLAFDPDAYRQRLNQALNLRDPSAIGAGGGVAPVAKIENPYDTEEMPMQQPAPPQEQPQQQGPNLGAVAQGVMGAMGGMGGGQQQQGGGSAMPNLGASTGGAMPAGAIDESGAMGQQAPHTLPIGENGKIDTRPPDLDIDSIDPDKLDKAKTIDDVFDAAPKKTQNAYMDWWEGAYGSINKKYDQMRGELGEYKKLPEKLSKKQMFMLLLGYGARMASNMRQGTNGINVAAASDDAFGLGQDVAMGNSMTEGQYGANLGAIEGGRAAELKGLGDRGDAMDKASQINYRDAQAANLGAKKPGDRITDENGFVFEVQKDSSLKQVMKPNGQPFKERQPAGSGKDSEFDRAYNSYMRAWNKDENGKPLTGAKLQKVEQAANDFARYGSREKDAAADPTENLRAAARDRVNTALRSSPDTFRDLDPDELTTKLGQMEAQEFDRLKRENLGSSPLQGGPRARAPERSEGYVKSHPEALADFVSDYGYVPEGMESYVTPAINSSWADEVARIEQLSGVGTNTSSGVGPPGPAGPAGAPGAAGATGPQGPAGSGGSGSFAIGPPGREGDEGPPGDAGPPGNPGPQGIAGATGALGQAGPPGYQGEAGEDGSPGFPGPVGPSGSAGAAGAAGPSGPPGVAGEDGESIVGPPGPQGPQGVAGSTGPAGVQGPQGLNGADGVDGEDGPRGSPGADGASGPSGPAGSAGTQGPRGNDGDDGDDGDDGAPGPVGPAGVAGSAGATGPQGALGYFLTPEDGEEGPRGPPGPAGASGAGGGGTYTDFTKDLGAADRSGTFDITGLSGLTPNKVVSIVQTMAPVASRGDARDEYEFDPITLTGYVVDATTIRALWACSGGQNIAVGTYAFAYQVGG